MKLVILGAPGAGKGTLAGFLKETFALYHISTGDILREEMKNNTALGQEVKGFVEKGDLVPDEVVTKLIENKFRSSAKFDKGFMLDGYPRTKTQAEELDRILKEVQQSIDFAIYLESTLPVIIQRLTGRRVCRNCGALYHIVNKPAQKDNVCDECGGELYKREDDNEETIKTRMDVYLMSTKPIIEYYESQGQLKKINGDQESGVVQKQLLEIFNENGKLNQH